MASFSPTIGKFGDVTSRQKPWTRWFKRHAWQLMILVIGLAVIGGGGLAWWYWQGNYRPASGGVVDEGMVGQPQYLNPLYSSLNSVDAELTPQIFRSLLTYDQSQKLVPDLAADWQVDKAGKVYTIHLAEATWQDGQPITARDVAFTIKLTQDGSYNGSWSGSFTDVTVKVIDSKRLTLTLKEPFAPFAQNLTMGILPEHVLSGKTASQLASDPFNLHPVGSGKLAVASMQAGTQAKPVESLTFKVNGGYLDNLTVHFYSDIDELLTDFKLGKIQAFGTLYDNRLDQLASFDKNQTEKVVQGQTYGLFFNMNSSLVKETKVRQALTYALDRPAIVDQALAGHGQVATTVYPHSSWAYYDQVEQYAYNQTKASSVMNEVDKAKRPSAITLLIPDKDSHSAVASRVVTAWKRLGVTVTVINKQGDDLSKMINARSGYDVVLLGEKTKQDPDRYVNWHSTQLSPKGLNISGLSNNRIDRALEEGRQLLGQDERKTKYVTFEILLAQEQPVIWLYQPMYVYTWSKKVYGVSLPEMWTEADHYNHLDQWYINVGRR